MKHGYWMLGLLLAAPLALAQERTSFVDPGDRYNVRPDQVRVPTCRDDQYTVADSQKFSCATFPTCAADQVITFSGNTFSCIRVLMP